MAAQQCMTGKVVHTFETATLASKRARRNKDKALAPYRCPYCGHYHVGTQNKPKRPLKTIDNNHSWRLA